MADIKKQIIEWFYESQDYESGLILLEQVSKKNKVLSKLMRKGETKSSFEKLIWELNKVAQLKTIPVRPSKVSRMLNTVKIKDARTSQDPSPGKDEMTEKISLIKDKDLDSYPKEVQRLVNEYSAAYRARGVKHKELKALGDGNRVATIDARKKILEEIKQLSARMELLYESFHEFEEKGIAPDADMLWPKPGEASGSNEAGKQLSAEELKTIKKNIQSSLTKDKNMLLYSSKTKPSSGKGKPLPAGPKRITLEKRIAKKEKEVESLEYKIAELS
jgi:uncharacterized coiled-coil protein SlyX